MIRGKKKTGECRQRGGKKKNYRKRNAKGCCAGEGSIESTKKPGFLKKKKKKKNSPQKYSPSPLEKTNLERGGGSASDGVGPKKKKEA